MTHLGLFEGIGGFSLAVKWAGGKTLAWCEWNEFGQKVLKYHFPEAEGYGDITKTDFRKYANKVDLLTGGFPCQPFSMAGKRKGTDDERYLWHEMLRAIQEVKPRFVIAENVFGITNIDGGLVFEQVCADLENEGYEVQPFIIPAASKNAPHRRDRVWFVAHANGSNDRRNAAENESQSAEERLQKRHEIRQPVESSKVQRTTANTDPTRLYKHIISTKSKEQDSCSRLFNEERNFSAFPTQSPICGGNDGLPTELDGITFSKWRAESIKAYGNAIVPQVAYELIKQLFFPIL